MKVSIQDIRRQYAELSDEGLLEIDREDLMDQARQCYDEELQRRQLARPRSAPGRPPAQPKEMTVAASYPSSEEAKLARDLVAAAGIPAYLDAANVGFQLFVPADDLEAANAVLQAQVSDDDLATAAVSNRSYIRHGVGSVRPYLYGKLDLIDFVQRTFDAEVLERHEFSATAFHVEARIGDSVIVMEASDPPDETAGPSSVYVYVEDVDETYRRALKAGAFNVSEPEDKPYDERSAGVMDSFGNTWWISTYTKS